MEMVLGDSGVFIQDVCDMERGAGWMLGVGGLDGLDGHTAGRNINLVSICINKSPVKH